jgi:F-type H+-transporting ATPase subunit delta
MSKMSVARPYAKAILLTANTQEERVLWSNMLSILSHIILLPDMQHLLRQNVIKGNDLIELMLSVSGEKLDDKAKNLVRILVERKRLGYLPEITTSFEMLRNEKENKIQVVVTSAVELEEKEMNAIANIFKQALSRQVEIKNNIDKTILGGFIARAGNYVLNSSLLSRLAELKEVMGR